MSLKDPNVVNPQKKKRVAIVIANPAVSTTTQWPVGFWWSELSHPYYVLDEAGYEVEIFSPKGGKCEADAISDPRDASGYSSSDLISMGFIATPKLAAMVEKTKPASEIDVEAFDAIVVAGGQAPMFTFESATDLHKKFVEFYEAGKIAVALCHGVAVLPRAAPRGDRSARKFRERRRYRSGGARVCTACSAVGPLLGKRHRVRGRIRLHHDALRASRPEARHALRHSSPSAPPSAPPLSRLAGVALATRRGSGSRLAAEARRDDRA